MIFALVFLLYVQACPAQADPWERVMQIEDTRDVSVLLRSGDTVRGQKEGWSTDGLGVRRGKGHVVRLAKSDIAKVTAAVSPQALPRSFLRTRS